ncbi:MAG: tRNA1(Val) (adenine(37)-N6)-methyltransferase [Bacillota bacterium]
MVLNETIEDLQLGGLTILQKKKGFRFGVDAVLLSNFVQVKKGDVVLDIGTGTGIIPILLAAKTQARHITGLEIQEEFAEMAARSVARNAQEKQISIIQGDIKDWESLFGKAKFDLVVSNPPYIEGMSGLKNSSDSVSIARHEIKCTLQDVVAAAAGVLRPNGRLAMIYRPHRLVDLFEAFRANGIEPKTIRFVSANVGDVPSLVVVQGTKFGKKELKVLENLYIGEAPNE